jgi:hypothetical protein
MLDSSQILREDSWETMGNVNNQFYTYAHSSLSKQDLNPLNIPILNIYYRSESDIKEAVDKIRRKKGF